MEDLAASSSAFPAFKKIKPRKPQEQYKWAFQLLHLKISPVETIWMEFIYYKIGLLMAENQLHTGLGNLDHRNCLPLCDTTSLKKRVWVVFSQADEHSSKLFLLSGLGKGSGP